MWLLFGTLSLIALLHYQNFEHQNFNESQSSLQSTKQTVRKFKARIESLSNGRTTENIISGISKMSAKDEIMMLNNAIILNEEKVETQSLVTQKKPKSLFPLIVFIGETQVTIAIGFLLLTSLIMTIFGFNHWYKMQKISDNIQKYELEFKRLQLVETKRFRTKR